MTSQDEILQQWCQELLTAFELEDVDLDPAAILSLAGYCSPFRYSTRSAAHNLHCRFCGRPRGWNRSGNGQCRHGRCIAGSPRGC